MIDLAANNIKKQISEGSISKDKLVKSLSADLLKRFRLVNMGQLSNGDSSSFAYTKLPIGFRLYFSETTQDARYSQNDISAQAYWDSLNESDQKEIMQTFKSLQVRETNGTRPYQTPMKLTKMYSKLTTSLSFSNPQQRIKKYLKNLASDLDGAGFNVSEIFCSLQLPSDTGSSFLEHYSSNKTPEERLALASQLDLLRTIFNTNDFNALSDEEKKSINSEFQGILGRSFDFTQLRSALMIEIQTNAEIYRHSKTNVKN